MVSKGAADVLGRIVTSRAGRDRGDRYVVVATLGGDTVLVADGERRSLDRPKKKNVKHLVLHDAAPELAAKLGRGEPLGDDEIRRALATAVPASPGEAAGV